MQKQIQRQITALNAVIQRSARTTGERLDPAIADALAQEYADAWEGLEGCGITEEMLASDPETLTFSLPAAGEQAAHLLTTMPLPAVMNQGVGRQRSPDDPQTQELPRT